VVEHFLGKEEVDSSILFNGSNKRVEVRKGATVPCPPKRKRRWESCLPAGAVFSEGGFNDSDDFKFFDF
jgi:hypothetical protein